MAAVQTRDDKVREDAVDKRLIAAYSRGNSHALSELYRRHSRRVESVARHVVGPSDEVEDIVQDVFIELQRALHKFRGESRFTTWLHRVTVTVLPRERVRLAVCGPLVDKACVLRYEGARLLEDAPLRRHGVVVDALGYDARRDRGLVRLARPVRATVVFERVE